jgi:hypothetical protein
MAGAAQIPLFSAAKVAQEAAVRQADNGICYATFGEVLLNTDDLERIVQSVPSVIAVALRHRAYYFVPLAIGENEDTVVAQDYSVDLSDRAICHRNVRFGGSECIFISTRLMQDRFALAFEFLINVGHHFVDAIGVPQSFADLAWSQATADVRGETSHDAWENRRRAVDRSRGGAVDEKVRSASTCSRSISISTMPICASATIRCFPRRRWPSASATWRSSSLPTRATNSRFDTVAGDKAGNRFQVAANRPAEHACAVARQLY